MRNVHAVNRPASGAPRLSVKGGRPDHSYRPQNGRVTKSDCPDLGSRPGTIDKADIRDPKEGITGGYMPAETFSLTWARPSATCRESRPWCFGLAQREARHLGSVP
jgi:hypothetical protein